MIQRIASPLKLVEKENIINQDLTDSVTQTGFLSDDEQLLKFLHEKSVLTNADVKKIDLLRKSGRTNLSISQLIMNLGLLSEADLLAQLSVFCRMRILQADDFPAKQFGQKQFNAQFLQQHQMVVIAETDDTYEICVNDPYAAGLQQALSFAIGQKYLKLRLGHKKDIQESLDRILMSSAESFENEKFEEIDAVLLDQDIQQLKELASEAPVVKIVNTIIQDAIQQNSSDIHIEPHSHQLKVRNRIDGVLITVREIEMRLSAAIVSRIKILSALDIAQRRIPQDGRFDTNIDGQNIDVRVSVIPTIYGESIVLRLLYKKSLSFDFESLGYSEKNKQKIFSMLDKPHGLILVTGPTGSGKSTTLYAMLQQINNSEKKIVSVEDPVEYKIDGINQIQVHSDIGVSFSSALRAIVRHDPEVIMVGEMRDSETAQIAVRASMTGHLILTTLHTNSAVASLERLIDLGVEKSFVFSSLVGVVAQRLVRRLCDHCKKPVASSHILIDTFEESSEDDCMNSHAAVGCEHCNQTGYKGRISICEVMTLNEDFRTEMNTGNTNIHQLALKHGMNSMVMDGFEKVRQGETTIEELFRVVLE